MRRAALPLLVSALLAAPAAWAAGSQGPADVLAPVNSGAVLSAVETCAGSKPEDIKDFACYKDGPAGRDGAATVSANTFAQAAVDLQFRQVDKRVLAYLELFKAATTAQPVDFQNSLLKCFDPTSAGPFAAACTDLPAGGSPRNFPQSYYAACDRAAELASSAMSAWNAARGSSLAFPSDGELVAVLRGESRPDGRPSCRALADRKLAAYEGVANLLARQAIQSGYDQARQEFVSRISAQYVALLQKMQRMASKLDLINDKWKNRTKRTYAQ